MIRMDTKGSMALDMAVNGQEGYHVPVLLRESVEALLASAGGVQGAYADLTLGGAGHTRALLARLGEKGRVLGFDQDMDAMCNAPRDERFRFVRSNFRFLEHWLPYYGVEGLDGILADLGVSSHHLDVPERGFSFRFEAPLDMRMNQRARLTAEEVVATYSEERLADVFYLYGELSSGRRMARAIVKARGQRALRTTADLVDVLTPCIGKEGSQLPFNSLRRGKKDMARAFQALRIEVNGELNALREMLASAVRCLRPGGRLVVLTYHGLEDRLVKQALGCEGLRRVGKKIVPGEEEVARNPRARSAKLHTAERI